MQSQADPVSGTERVRCWEIVPYFTLITLIVLYVSMFLVILNPSIWPTGSLNTLLPSVTIKVVQNGHTDVNFRATSEEDDKSLSVMETTVVQEREKSQKKCMWLTGDPRPVITHFGLERNHRKINKKHRLQVFTNYSFPVDATIHEVEFYQSQIGQVYLSFWRQVKDTDWKMVGQIPLKTNGKVPLLQQQMVNKLGVKKGDVFATHYPHSLNQVIPHDSTYMADEYNEGNFAPGIHYQDLSEYLVLKDHKEGEAVLEKGKVYTMNKKHSRMVVTLRIYYC